LLKWKSSEGLQSLAVRLVKQNSISGTKNEIDMARLIYGLLEDVPYFKGKPQNLFLQSLEDDLLERNFVTALVEGKGKSKDTLILVGHMDTVDVQDFITLKEYALDPYEYTKRLDADTLPKDARDDLLSGSWLFGRGIMDMKAGVAWQMALLEEYSTLEDFDGNLLFIVVPDEESNSSGRLSGIPFLNKIIKEKNLNPIAALNCEPNFGAYPGDNNTYIYLGTAGKLVPGFYFVGKESHVGESLSGLNVNLIAAEFIRRLDINTDLCDVKDDEVTVPPTSLKYKDSKELYSGQTPVTSVAYYNIQTLQMSPKTALEKLREIAEYALDAAIEKVKVHGERYKGMSGLPVEIRDFKPKILYYSELCELANRAHGEKFKTHMENCLKNWTKDSSMDERELNLKLVSEVHSFCSISQSMIVLYYTPPYYPHVGLKDNNEFDRKLIELADKLIKVADNDYGEKILKQKYFQGLSDLSYFALQDAEDVIEYLAGNTPSWGFRYKFPIEEIKKLNIPVLNFGPHGRNPHKYTERILTNYSFDIGPKLLRFLVNEIFDL